METFWKGHQGKDQGHQGKDQGQQRQCIRAILGLHPMKTKMSEQTFYPQINQQNLSEKNI